jgi:hypothetical protein
MKNCKEIKQLLSAYADGELSGEERKAIDKHIETCTGCKKALDAHLELHAQLLTIADTPALPNVDSSIMSAITGIATRKSRRWLRPVLVATPIVLVAAILLTILLPSLILTPKTVLARAQAALPDIQSYQMTSACYTYLPKTNEFIHRLYEQYAFAGDRYYLIWDYNLSVQQSAEWINPPTYYREVIGPDEWELIGIGELTYGRGEELPSIVSTTPEQRQAYALSAIMAEKQLERLNEIASEIEVLPEENIDGVLCYHYLIAVDTEKYVEQVNDNWAWQDTTMTEELWIGKDDYIIRQRKCEYKHELTSTVFMFKYYDFNAPISIEPPLDAEGNLLPGWSIIPRE